MIVAVPAATGRRQVVYWGLLLVVPVVSDQEQPAPKLTILVFDEEKSTLVKSPTILETVAVNVVDPSPTLPERLAGASEIEQESGLGVGVLVFTGVGVLVLVGVG